MIEPEAKLATLHYMQQLEARATLECSGEMEELRTQFPDWFALYEDMQPDTAGCEEVLALLTSAPNAFSKGLMMGKFSIRMEYAAITGRWL